MRGGRADIIGGLETRFGEKKKGKGGVVGIGEIHAAHARARLHV